MTQPLSPVTEQTVRPLPDRETISRLFSEHIRLLPFTDEPDSLWYVKPESKAAFINAVLALTSTQAPAQCDADARPPEAPEWIWYGEVDGKPRISYGRWPKNGTVWRYKWAEIQPTEHDHAQTARQDRQALEGIIERLNYDGTDTDSLTVGEIRRALP